MKAILSIAFAVAATLFVSCSKNEATAPPHELAGSWRLVSITDHDANTVIQQSAGETGENELNFVFNSGSGGVITARTPVNAFNGSFTLGSGGSLIIQGDYTKVAEQPLGSVFLCNLHFTNDYTIEEGRRLLIKTSSRKTFVLAPR